jgi:hypothetical protein
VLGTWKSFPVTPRFHLSKVWFQAVFVVPHSWVTIMLGPTTNRPVLLPGTRFGPKTRFSLLSHSCGFVDVRRPLWREDGSVVYNCWWASIAQSFSGNNPVGLLTIFYCLRFEAPPTWRARSPYLHPQEQGGPIISPWNGFVTTPSLPTTNTSTLSYYWALTFTEQLQPKLV